MAMRPEFDPLTITLNGRFSSYNAPPKIGLTTQDHRTFCGSDDQRSTRIAHTQESLAVMHLTQTRKYCCMAA